ncbi:hypothetical protein GCM10009109_30560 [Marinobacterium sediminicola]
MNGVDYSKPESDEVRQLKRERDALKKELEFLKKAADGRPPPYFASQHE